MSDQGLLDTRERRRRRVTKVVTKFLPDFNKNKHGKFQTLPPYSEVVNASAPGADSRGFEHHCGQRSLTLNPINKSYYMLKLCCSAVMEPNIYNFWF